MSAAWWVALVSSLAFGVLALRIGTAIAPNKEGHGPMNSWGWVLVAVGASLISWATALAVSEVTSR